MHRKDPTSKQVFLGYMHAFDVEKPTDKVFMHSVKRLPKELGMNGWNFHISRIGTGLFFQVWSTMHV